MTTDVDVANMALDNIGAGLSITSLAPPLPAPNADKVARHYQPKIDALFRSAHWNCARRQVALTVLRAAQGTLENPTGALPQPPKPWLYEYAYPSDCLAVRFLSPNPPQSTGTSPPIFPGSIGLFQGCVPFEGWRFVVGIDSDPNKPNDPTAQVKVVLTNLQYADAIYTARIPNPDLWDPHFLLGATATLGAWLVNPINMNEAILRNQVAIATSVVLQARISDGNEGLESVDHLPDWMQVRGDPSFGIGPAGMGLAYYGWGSLALPGALV